MLSQSLLMYACHCHDHVGFSVLLRNTKHYVAASLTFIQLCLEAASVLFVYFGVYVAL